MRMICIIHRHEPAYGWSFEIPDLDGLIGGPEPEADYDRACRFAEDAAHFLECEAEERGELVPRDVAFVHRVLTSA